MSRVTITGSTRDPKRDWNELDVDEIVDQLTPGEIQSLLDECDPDDPHIPPSLRCNYKCDKTPQVIRIIVRFCPFLSIFALCNVIKNLTKHTR